MPPLESIDILSTAYQTANVQTIQLPPGVLTEMLDPGTSESPGTDTIEYGEELRSRESAEFLNMGAEPIFVGDRERNLTNLRIPYLAMQKSLRAGDIANDRSIGESIFRTNGGQSRTNGTEARITRYQTDMRARIENTMEWWMSQMILGTVSYANDKYASFIYDFGRSAALDMLPAGGNFWDGGSNNRPDEDLQTVKRTVADLNFTDITVALCASDVASWLRGSTFFQNLFNLRNVNETRETSYVDSSAPYRKQGALTPIGRTNGIEFWEYNRSLPISGTLVPMIRPKHIEFLSMGSDMDIRKFWGPIYDLTENREGPVNETIYGKSWEIRHPSQIRLIVESRPMYAPFKPNSFASMRVLT